MQPISGVDVSTKTHFLIKLPRIDSNSTKYSNIPQKMLKADKLTRTKRLGSDFSIRFSIKFSYTMERIPFEGGEREVNTLVEALTINTEAPRNLSRMIR